MRIKKDKAKCYVCGATPINNALVMHVRVGTKYKYGSTCYCDQCAKEVLTTLFAIEDKVNWVTRRDDQKITTDSGSVLRPGPNTITESEDDYTYFE